MITLLIYLLFALGVSFLCSLLESILLSVTHAYTAVLIRDGRRVGTLLRDMKKNIDTPLAAILTVNTVANVVGAAGVGAQAYSVFGSEWVAVASGTLTILILVCSEIIPKTLGTVYWKKLAPSAVYAVKTLVFLTYPVVMMLQVISGAISRGGRHHARLTRDEIMVLAEIGEHEGILQEKEARIMRNLFLMDDIHTGEILTPRAVMFACQKDRTVEDVIDEYSPIPFSRIPVFGESLDDIVGVVLRKELLEAYHSGNKDSTLESFVSPVHVIPETKTITDLLDEFIRRREHIFSVIDEYGGTEGIVTLEDAVETLLGVEIVDEYDTVEDMRELALERWRKKHSKRQSL